MEPTASNFSFSRRMIFPHGLSLKSDAAWIKRSVSGIELINKTIKIRPKTLNQ